MSASTRPQKIRHCEISGREYEVSAADLTFYSRMGVPPPRLCPDERARRRLAWRNERNLYRRRCSATGREIVSIYSPDKSFPVYSQDYWWSDRWDAKNFARPVDLSQPFFPQFAALYGVVPQLAINNSESENSEYTNQSQNNKNCYLLIASNYNEECLHGMWFQRCRDSVDCLYLEGSELCYEMVGGRNCYGCMFSENLDNCYECVFCRDCTGCHACVGSINLRNKEYYFFNAQCTRGEYAKRLADLDLESYSGVTRAHAAYAAADRRYPRKFYTGRLCENFSGDYLSEVRNTFDSFNCRHCENVRYLRDAWRARNCYDLTETLENDWCLELEGCDRNVECFFSRKLHDTHSSWYSAHCFFSHDLFGCVGVRNSSYCILNGQYSREDYTALVAEIRARMERNGEWGEHLPIELSPFGYNETVAQEYFPLTRFDAVGRGWKWWDPECGERPSDGERYTLPDRVRDTPDTVVDEVLFCKRTGARYRIGTAELRFYRKMNLPLPRISPDERHRRRMALRNPRVLAERQCDRCGSALQSTFSSDVWNAVYCESCYLEAVE